MRCAVSLRKAPRRAATCRISCDSSKSRALAPGRGTIDETPGRQGRDPRVEQGYMYCGPAGSGHFVKMVHNGIEYGLMQAYAEGFEVLQKAASPKLPEGQRYNL